MTDQPMSHDDEILPTPDDASIVSDHEYGTRPSVKASVERNKRRNNAIIRRRIGIDLDGDEIQGDLMDITETLRNHIKLYQVGTHQFMQSRADMVAYVERATFYATQDYPRDFGTRTDIRALWDSLNSIHTGSSAWLQGEYQLLGANARVIVEAILGTVENALKGRFMPFDGTLSDEDA